MGVDPISNFVYVPVSQYPASATATVGVNEVAVFEDTTPPAQSLVTEATASLSGIGNASTGTAYFVPIGSHMHVYANASGLPASATGAWITVPTTVANEVWPCAVNPANATAVCSDDMLGDPLIGAMVTSSTDNGSGGVATARGMIVRIQ